MPRSASRLRPLVRTARALLRNRLVAPTPVYLQIKPTYRCNQRCSFCNVWKFPGEELDTQGFLSILDQAARLGVGVVNFSGGEPLLRPDTPTLIAHAQQLGLLTLMNTNGWFLKERLAELASVLHYVAVSIDFDNAADHDSFRREDGAFDRALGSIEAAHDAGLRTRINCVVMRSNRGQLDGLARLAQRLRVPISFSPMLEEFAPTGRALRETNSTSHDLAMPLEDYCDTVERLRAEHPNVSTPAYFLRAIRNASFRCRATDTVINVQPDGTAVLPCEVRTLGSYDAQTLSSSYASSEVRGWAQKNGSFDFCAGCASQCSLTPSLLSSPWNQLAQLRAWTPR